MRLELHIQRERDIDSTNKLVQDALEGIWYENDKQIIEMHVYKIWDKKDPHVDVEVWEV